MHWFFQFLYGSEIWTLEKKRTKKTDINRDEFFSEKQPFLTTKGMKRFWKSWKWNQLTRNYEDTKTQIKLATTRNKNEQQ